MNSETISIKGIDKTFLFMVFYNLSINIDGSEASAGTSRDPISYDEAHDLIDKKEGGNTLSVGYLVGDVEIDFRCGDINSLECDFIFGREGFVSGVVEKIRRFMMSFPIVTNGNASRFDSFECPPEAGGPDFVLP